MIESSVQALLLLFRHPRMRCLETAIMIREIIILTLSNSNGRVYYHYNLHETGKKELEVVRPVLFLKRMMQHVMPRISRECGIVVSKRQPLSRNIYQ
jgi:hypothetical protein